MYFFSAAEGSDEGGLSAGYVLPKKKKKSYEQFLNAFVALRICWRAAKYTKTKTKAKRLLSEVHKGKGVSQKYLSVCCEQKG